MDLKKFRCSYEYDKSKFHFNNAGISPISTPAKLKGESVLKLLAEEGIHCFNSLIDDYAQARISFANLVGCSPENLAFFQTCASAISQVALGFPFSTHDEILCWDQEYPSNAYPWVEASKRSGAKLKFVSSNQDFSVDTSKLVEAITPQTKMIVASWFQFQTGAETNLKELSTACKSRGKEFGTDIWVVTDAIQGLGIVPFDIGEMGVDAVCGGTHKWLSAPIGHGFLGLAPDRAVQLRPLLHGTLTYGEIEEPFKIENIPHQSARRFEPGSPHLLGALTGAASVDLLQSFGIEAANKEALRLSHYFSKNLADKGWERVGPENQRHPILTFIPPTVLSGHEKIEILVRGLWEKKIACAPRAGGVRFSPHAFNTDEEISQALEIL